MIRISLENKLILWVLKMLKLNKGSWMVTLLILTLIAKENQTGTFTAGASFGTLDGITPQLGINENNIAGTGRRLGYD